MTALAAAGSAPLPAWVGTVTLCVMLGFLAFHALRAIADRIPFDDDSDDR